MSSFPTNKDNDISLLKKLVTNTKELVDGGGGGGGAVDSVNGQTGVVVLDNTDVGSPSTAEFQTAESEIDQLEADVAALAAAVGDGGGNTSVSGNYLITGPTIAHTEDLTVTIGAATYVIQGVEYTSPQMEITAAVADGSNPRLDAIVLNTSSVAAFITGTPAASPVKPEVDPLTQIEISHIEVAAAATVIEVNVEDIYREGAEWTDTQSGGTIDLADTTDPNTGTNAIKGTSSISGDYFMFEDAAPRDIEAFNNLVLFVKPTTWGNAKQWNITARNGGVVIGNAVVLKNGVYGLNTATPTVWQQIAIPTTAFGTSGSLVDQIRFTVAGGGPAMTFLVDDVTLQGGLSQTTDSSRMRFIFGGWIADKFYNKNDTVFHTDSNQYVAKRANINRDPSTGSDDWEMSSVADSSSAGSKTLFIPAGAMVPSKTAGCDFLATVETVAGRPDLSYLGFDASTEEYAQFSVAMPKSWNNGTLTAKFHWSHAATTTNFDVIWGIAAISIGNDDNISTAFGTAQTVTDTGGTTDDLYNTSLTSAMTAAGTPATGDVVFFRVHRQAADVADNLAIDARLHGVTVIYTVSAGNDD